MVNQGNSLRRKPATKSKIFYFLLAAYCLVVISAGGCGPTYPRESFEESILEVCKEEYDVDVKIKKVGRTLGVYVPIEGLFEAPEDLGEDASLEKIVSGLRFSPNATENIDDVCMSVSRVCLSTDSAIDFYVVIAGDTKMPGANITLTRHVTDIKRILTGDISRGDFVQRMLLDVDYDPTQDAEALVKEFYKDLETKDQKEILGRYFSKTAYLRNISSGFFLILSELEFKDNRSYEIKDLKAKRIARDKVLVLSKTKETFRPKKDYEKYKFVYPPDSENECLFVIDYSIFPYTFINAVYPLRLTEKSGKAVKLSYPRQFARFQQEGAWQKEDFFLEEVKLPDFLSRQIANRIRTKFQEDTKLSQKFILKLVAGEYARQTPKFSVFRFTVDLQENPFLNTQGVPEAEKEKAEAEIFKIICQVLRRYEFKNFNSVELMNITHGTTKHVTRTELLEQYKPRWLRWNKFK